MRYFKEEPLPHKNRNNLSKSDKLQIINDLWEDYNNGLLDNETISWIINNDRFGHFTCQLIIEDMLRKIPTDFLPLESRIKIKYQKSDTKVGKKIIKKDFTGKIGEKSSEQRKNKYEL